MSDTTLKVKPWSDDQGDYVLIDAASFDPNFHQRLDDTGSDDGKPSKGLKVEELKAALDAKGIEYPSTAQKADLAKLLDDSVQAE